MIVPLLDLKEQLRSIAPEIKEAVNRVIDSCRYILGPEVEALEEETAAYCGAAHGVAVSSGTDALLIALMALNLRPGDLVLTTPYSFFATAGVIARLGAEPVFIDIHPRTFNLHPPLLRSWWDQNPSRRGRVKAIIPVHLFGQCADMDAILDFAAPLGIPVIEDAAQAIGAVYPSRTGLKKAGSMGLAGCFSFFPSKNLGGLGEGGLVTTNDPDFAARLRILRNHGMDPKYYHAAVGGNFRLDAIQAAPLRVKLRHLDSWHEGRRKNAEFYDQRLSETAVMSPALAYSRGCHIYNQYVLTIESERNALRDFLTENRIGCEVYYPRCLHQQACFASLGYADGAFPASEHAAKTSLALPIYPELTKPMLEHVCRTISGFFAQRDAS